MKTTCEHGKTVREHCDDCMIEFDAHCDDQDSKPMRFSGVMTTPIDLPALKKLADAATPGPWLHCEADGMLAIGSDNGDKGTSENWTGPNVSLGDSDNGKFIAAARTEMPRLIEKIEFLTQLKWDTAKTVDKLEAELNRATFESDLRASERDRSESMYEKLLNDEKSACLRGNRLAQENQRLEVEVANLNGRFGTDQRRIDKLNMEVGLLREELERSRAAYDNACDNWKSCVQIVTERDKENTALKAEVERLQIVAAFPQSQVEADLKKENLSLLSQITALRELLRQARGIVQDARDLAQGNGPMFPKLGARGDELLPRIDAALGQKKC